MNDEERLIWGKYLSGHANRLRQELEDLDELLNELGKPFTEEEPKAEKPTLDKISSLIWEDKQSDKGNYQKTSKEANQNNPTFQRLQSNIKKHNGFMILHGFKFWTFSSNPDVIGRRKQ